MKIARLERKTNLLTAVRKIDKENEQVYPKRHILVHSSNPPKTPGDFSQKKLALELLNQPLPSSSSAHYLLS